ncbi:hypothetical protein [Streptacidiphilus rugosus]|uniref:hypothetical protein n=1 Tax=Streptacidiphilus rugosus TaxID=405783 RepID=UPI000560BAAD|nr:hypothetical protein [Streptacidiphilus rugosus]
MSHAHAPAPPPETTLSRPAASGLASSPQPDPVLDRAIWKRLRAAARLGNLQPEGALIVQELHEQYPEWREQWSR